MANKIRKITSHYVLTPQGLVRGAILSFDDSGKIVDITISDRIDEHAGVEFFSGILIPGMVNAHSHIELSYLRGAIQKGCTFGGFADSISIVRHKASLEERIEATKYWDAKMFSDGVTAIGDICNGNESFSIKQKSHIYYHNFIEYFGLRRVDFSDTDAVLQQALEQNIVATPTPHSTYSLANKIFTDIASKSERLSIHFMESRGEAELFDSCGPLHKQNVSQGLMIDFAHYGSPTERLIASTPPSAKLLLIHNTFVSRQEVVRVENHFQNHPTWVLCPRSNSYIEDATPPYEILMNEGVRIAVGTDSLASNETLSMIDELKMFRGVPMPELLKWATINGAQALGIESWAGSFEVGKRPGAVLITGVDWEQMSLNADAKSRRII